ncbi:hypothetical protein ACC724_38220, partial [Rhizobium ruizarguesonis]
MNNVLEFRSKCPHVESLSDCREALEPAVMKIVSDASGQGHCSAARLLRRSKEAAKLLRSYAAVVRQLDVRSSRLR